MPLTKHLFLVGVFLPAYVAAHGKLTTPAYRKNPSYDSGPVSGGPDGDEFVCRVEQAGSPAVTLTAGTATSLSWTFTASHPGDCALFLSYDHAKPRAEMKWFKLANFPDCNKNSGESVSVTLPTWLPPGQAVMRWDWYALHVFPTVEFYAQCVDVTVVESPVYSAKAIAAIDAYTLKGKYPKAGNDEQTQFWYPFSQTKWHMEGPSCAPEIVGNCCDLSGYQRGGYKECSLSGKSPPTTVQVDPAKTTGNAGSVSHCTLHVVAQGETLAAIAEQYQEEVKDLTWQKICSENGISNCDVLEVGDNVVIPGTCDTSNKNPVAGVDGTLAATGSSSGAKGHEANAWGHVAVSLALVWTANRAYNN
jgi:hypothetical protein